VLGKVDMLVAVLGALVLAGAYCVGFLPEALALVLLTVVLVTTGTRAWLARHGGLEYGFLRHPFRRELGPQSAAVSQPLAVPGLNRGRRSAGLVRERPRTGRGWSGRKVRHRRACGLTQKPAPPRLKRGRPV
jgi:hypothetical protein